MEPFKIDVPKVFCEEFVLTEPFEGVGDGIWCVQDLTRGPILVPLLSAGPSKGLEPQLTAPHAPPPILPPKTHDRCRRIWE